MPASPETGLDPIIVTTLGRTGGTWVTQLLASHPDVIAYPPFRSEIKVASYWAEVLMHLSEPGGYLQSVQALVGGDDWWLGRGRRYDEEQTDEELTHWLGKGQIESIRDFCRGRVDAFYRDLADRMGDGEPSYFVEKGLPNPLGQLELMQSMYPGMREIVLVRDFRDMLSSIFAYNDKRGFPYFGRDLANSDEEYVANYLGPDVDRLARAWRQRSDTAHLLRYEDLVFEPQETLAAVLTYLELEPDTGVIDHMLATGSAKPTEGQRGHPTTASARESVGRWADDLSPELIRACESAFGVALQTFGYSVGRVGATATAGGTS